MIRLWPRLLPGYAGFRLSSVKVLYKFRPGFGKVMSRLCPGFDQVLSKFRHGFAQALTWLCPGNCFDELPDL